MDNSATVHLPSGPKQPRSVRGTHQLNASCTSTPGSIPRCHLHPKACHRKQTPASSRRTPAHNTNVPKVLSMSFQILKRLKEMGSCARRVSRCAHTCHVAWLLDLVTAQPLINPVKSCFNKLHRRRRDGLSNRCWCNFSSWHRLDVLNRLV